jgi:integrase
MEGFAMYRQNDGWWYFRYKDENGKWRTYATRTKDEKVASEIEENFKLIHERRGNPKSLADLLYIYMDYSVNPEYLDAKITGRIYGERHSKEVARNMHNLLDLLERKTALHKVKLKDLTRMQCKAILSLIHKEWGNTSKANKMFSQFKRCLTYAAEQGWIQMSPAQGMSDIKVEEQKEVIPMTPNDIAEIIARPELFRFSKPACNRLYESARKGRDMEDYTMFCLLAYTGMRRAEAAALTSGQICNGIYRGEAFHYINVDRAFKNDEYTVVDKPKWNLCRSIPICEELYEILKPFISKNPDDRIFPDYTANRFRQLFDRLKENVKLDGIVFEDEEAFDMLSAHKLRHALNTNLLADQGLEDGEVTEIMVAEYLSWEHQDQSKMQKRYTHMVASRLLPVSDLISKIYSYKAGSELLTQSVL